jgi:hypothetical protein
MDASQLQELKQKLLHEQELAPVWSFFLSHFGEDPGFIALGERAGNPFVEAVVAQVGRQLFGQDGAVRGLLLTRVADQHFIHGGFSMGARIGGVFYFEDAHIGLVVVADAPPSTEVKYARFSSQPVRPPGKPSPN